MDKVAHWFAAKGLPSEGTERPFMGRVLRTRDLWGVPLEFYAKMDRLPPIHQKYALYRGVKPLRIDHFNLFSSNVDAAVEFYREMGFRLTEYTADEATGCMTLPLPTGRGHACIIRRFGCPRPLTSSIFWI